MEKDNPLLPFAFTTSSANDRLPLNTAPRNRSLIDENASSMYHTRTTPIKKRGPTLDAIPSLKRKMGASFNEKDDVKRREIPEIDSEPTIVDSEVDTDDDKENKHKHKLTFGLPSSPTAEPHMDSEFDISTSRYDIPDSPSHLPSEPHSEVFEENFLQTSKAKTITLHQLSSEADFGIDQFNRFKTASQQCPSTDRDVENEEYKQFQRHLQESARQIVINAFEETNTTINLEGMELRDLPEEIKDLDHLVVFGSNASYQLFLANNKLRSLPLSLFKYTKLQVLGLRLNKLTRIPGAIKNLYRLQDLSLGINRLEYLNPAILELPHLETFRAGPNPFLKVSSDAQSVTTATLNPQKNKKYVSPVIWKSESRKVVPSLKTRCLDTIARYDVSYQETKNWKKHTPKVLHSIIAKAISQGKYQETCSECSVIIVQPVAEGIEWWDILQNKDVPFKKEFCSGMCAMKWSRSTLCDTQ